HVHNPRVPRALSAVCLRMLEKAPEARYPSAEALGEALEAVLAQADAAWDIPLCEAYGPDTATTEVEGDLEDEQEEARWRRLEAHERLHPVRGEPSSSPEEPATLAPPTGEAPPTGDAALPAPAPAPPRARGSPWRWGVVASLGLVLGLGLGLTHRPPPGAAPQAAGVTPPVAAALPTPGVASVPGQEVAPGRQPPEGGSGAVPEAAPTPAPAARTAPPKDTRVKSLLQPPSQQPPPPPRRTRGVASTVGGLALTCSLATGCPGPTTPQVRPTPGPEACPPGALEAMETLGIGIGASIMVSPTESGGNITVREGETAVTMYGKLGTLEAGTVLHGRFIVGEHRVYGRFTLAQKPNGDTFPVCVESQGGRSAGIERLDKGGGASAEIYGTWIARAVERFE
ncbi:MAG TPA: hypothetical protein VEZ71_30765, partial [Archangium sp.]|nr:hypothetical protein [Archangium sp.]